jgi:hypothetical protein
MGLAEVDKTVTVANRVNLARAQILVATVTKTRALVQVLVAIQVTKRDHLMVEVTETKTVAKMAKVVKTKGMVRKNHARNTMTKNIKI